MAPELWDLSDKETLTVNSPSINHERSWNEENRTEENLLVYTKEDDYCQKSIWYILDSTNEHQLDGRNICVPKHASTYALLT